MPETQFLIRVLNIMEAMWGFTTMAFYVRTYHNILADGLTRDNWEEWRDRLLAEGWRQVSIQEAWAYFLEEIDRQHLLRLGCLAPCGARPEDIRLARQLAKQRGGRRVPLPLQDGGVLCVEVFSVLGGWSRGPAAVIPLNNTAGRALQHQRPQLRQMQLEDIESLDGPFVLAYSGGGAEAKEETAWLR